MTIAPFSPGEIITAHKLLVVRGDYQEPVSGGPSSGTNILTLATLVVPAQPIATRQLLSASWTGTATDSGSRYQFAIQDDSAGGTNRQVVEQNATVANHRLNFSIVNALGRAIAVNTAATYVCVVVRSSGTGTINTALTGRLTAVVTPDL